MQKIIKHLFIIFALNFIGTFGIHAQKSSVKNAEVNLSTPQTYDFMRYGNTPVNLNSGEINLTVPIYTYKDNDFEVPVFIGYNSSGFLPNKRDGIVGNNWYLNAGGIITRQVNGVPDEIDRSVSIFSGSFRGMYAGYKNGYGVGRKTLYDIYNFVDYTDLGYEYNIDDCEVAPDKFSISAPGLKGSFIIQNNGIPRCLDNGALVINIDGLAVYYEGDQTLLSYSEIVITNENGYKYYFGGDLNYLEINSPIIKTGTEFNPIIQIEKSMVVNAWHLKKIVAPNKRSVNYNYYEMPYSYYNIYSNADFFVLSLSKVQFYSSSSSCTNFSWLDWLCNGTTATMPPQNSYYTTKTVYLKDITIDNTKIEFSFN